MEKRIKTSRIIENSIIWILGIVFGGMIFCDSVSDSLEDLTTIRIIGYTGFAAILAYKKIIFNK